MQLAFLLVTLFVVGAVFGSFACCQAWRWHFWVEKQEKLGARSLCMNCKYQLKWYDNVPIISWLWLRGRCRKCKRKIGIIELGAEIGMGAAFLLVGEALLVPLWDRVWTGGPGEGDWWLGVAMGFVTLALLVVLGILAVYDAKWRELPVTLLYAAIGLGAISFLLKEWQLYLNNGEVWWGLLSALLGVGILAGTYLFLYKGSRERLIGGGDWLLALALALALADWWLSLWALFLANFLGAVSMLPVALKTKQHKVAFGPFLVIGFVLVLVLEKYLAIMQF